MKRWAMSRLLIAAFAVTGATSGLVVGGMFVTPTAAMAAEADCENDECDRVCGVFTCGQKTCIDNPGGNTACPMNGSECSTTGCEAT